MTVEVRNVGSDAEYEEFVHLDGRVFGNDYQPDDVAALRDRLVPDRVVVALERGRIVGGGGVYPLGLTLPGGAVVPAAGITWVSTEATHRRRGVLREVMRRLHEHARELGEPAQILTASEGSIYERFGYGIASFVRNVTIERRMADIRSDAPHAGHSVVLDHLPLDERVALCDDVYERYARRWPGAVTMGSRGQAFWSFFIGPIGEKAFGGKRHLVAHVDDEGRFDGFVLYRLEAAWDDRGPNGTAHLWPVFALTPQAHADLWRSVLGVDLAARLELRALHPDDPLPLLLTNVRALRTTSLRDDLWLRPDDPAALLSARAYGDEGTLHFAVDADTYTLEARSGTGACATTTHPPQLTMSSAALGAILLGTTPPSALAEVGRIRGEASAIALADRLFRSERAPRLDIAF